MYIIIEFFGIVFSIYTYKKRAISKKDELNSDSNNAENVAIMAKTEHNYCHPCPTDYCQNELIRLSSAIAVKEKEIQKLRQDLAYLSTQRPRMKIQQIKDDEQKVNTSNIYIHILNYYLGIKQ